MIKKMINLKKTSAKYITLLASLPIELDWAENGDASVGVGRRQVCCR